MGGVAGACVAAAAAFLPCLCILLAVGPAVERLRSGPKLSVFLRGMGAAAAGSIVAVAALLLPPAVTGAAGAALFLACLAAQWRFEPGWVLAAAGLAGAVFL